MSSLKTALKSHQKTHKERSQLIKRKHLGNLEKHKDYAIRARDFHRKEKHLKSLQRKAREKNPDEFYFKMISEKTKDGVHQVARSKTFTHEQIQLMKTQDINYINLKKSIEAKKIEKLKSSLHMLDAADSHPRKHTFFVDSKEEVANFDPAKRLNTLPELLDRAHNRPTIEMLRNKSFSVANLERLDRAKKSSYRELESRINRANVLERSRQQLALQRHLMRKGGRVFKSKNDSSNSGRPVYRWKKMRKR